MAGKTPYDADIAALKKQQEKLTKDLTAMGKRIDLMQGALEENNLALMYVMKYMGALLAELNARGLTLTRAIARFSKFLDLPEKSSSLDAVIDLAFTALSTVVPALRLTGVLHKLEKNASFALEVATHEPAWLRHAPVMREQTARLVKSIPKANEVTADLKRVSDTRLKGLVVLKDDTGGFDSLKRLDSSSRGPVHEQVNYANAAVASYHKVLDILGHELNLRLRYPEIELEYTMEQLVKGLLPLPEFFTPEDLDDLELMFLHLMIAEHVKRFVTIRRQVLLVGANVRYSISGLNNAQQDTIMEYFSFTTRHGKLYRRLPSFRNIYEAMYYWKATETNENVQMRGGQ